MDTSAFLAVLDADDANHAATKATWEQLVRDGGDLVCTSYVLVESFALIQNRLGVDAVRAFHESVVPFLYIEWIDAHRHASSVAALLTAARRNLSLVDCSSFDAMRRLGITTVFTFDHHFAEQGFACIP
ncbi:MAG: PIN domain-containing protein [Chloroflexota bacterium]